MLIATFINSAIFIKCHNSLVYEPVNTARIFLLSFYSVWFVTQTNKKRKKKDNNSKVLYSFLQEETIKVHCLGVRLKMCEEAHSNQVKKKKKTLREKQT